MSSQLNQVVNTLCSHFGIHNYETISSYLIDAVNSRPAHSYGEIMVIWESDCEAAFIESLAEYDMQWAA